MDTENVSQYLSLYHGTSISTPVFARLLREFGTLNSVRNLPQQQLLSLGFAIAQIVDLQGGQQDTAVRQLVERDLIWAAGPQNSIVTYESRYYPALLKEIQCPPPLLYVVGQKSKLITPQFAIVGSRKSSNYGKRNAYWMANELSQAGLTICSGMAKGIDSHAHQGALDAACPTIAVVGTGADRIYPACNSRLAQQISMEGAIVSEFPLGTAPLTYNFPRRNRIISGMSLGTLVVEASAKSGSLITSRFAMEQNRDVFAFPGPITSQTSRGCHSLIKDGAKLVEKPEDILEELGLDLRHTPPGEEQAGGDSSGLEQKQQDSIHLEQQILRTMGYQGCVMQVLLEDTGIGLQQLNMQLLQLEMRGRIITEAGRYFRIN